MKKDYNAPVMEIEILSIVDTVNASTYDFDTENKDYYERIPA